LFWAVRFISVLQAQNSTAQVSIVSVTKVQGSLQADVLVQNLAGHNFPSGVSFRRAFLNFQVFDAANNLLWASGNTNSDGVIVDQSGKTLTTEFFSPTQQNFQPHFWTENPITADNQVEIYEELVTDPQGMRYPLIHDRDAMVVVTENPIPDDGRVGLRLPAIRRSTLRPQHPGILTAAA
jgi:hypothetical protein